MKVIAVLFVAIFALMAVVGTIAVVLVMPLSFVWCKVDVESNGFVMPTGSSMLCGLIPPVGVVSHLYRTRSGGEATLALLKVMGVVFLAVLAYVLTVASILELAA